MRTRIILAAAIAAVLLLVPTALGSPDVGEPDNGFSKADERYLELYEQAHKQGFDVGRNLLDSAWTGTEPVSDERIAASAERLNLWLNPPPAPEPAEVSAEYAVPSAEYAAAPTSSAGGMGCVGMEAESGSLGYAEPGGDGYVGCYQIAEQHYEGGMCSGLGTDPAGQDACAARICEEQGAGAWTNAAGANPC